MKWCIEYYQKTDGKIPVVAFIDSMPIKMKAKIFREIGLLEEHGIQLGLPYIKGIEGKKYQGLYELRIKQSTDHARIFYFLFHGNTFVLLHGFLKKSNKTPISELERAMSYKEDYERREQNE